MHYKLITISILIILMSNVVIAQPFETNILVFSKTAAFRHTSIPVGIKFLKTMGEKNNWNISFSENVDDFTFANLSQFDALVFLNTSGNIFNEYQKTALKNYLTIGKGFVGIHAASDTEKEWDWYGEMVGATFKDHPKIQNATLEINTTCKHPAIKGWKNVEVFEDEWYNFIKPAGKHVSVLAALDETSYEGKKMGSEHPISWYHLYDGGRVFYTGLGHTDEIYDDVRFNKHIEGAILWATGITYNAKAPEKWTNLLGKNPYENWDVFMGAPHATVKDLDNVNPQSNGKNSIPLGLNNDPKNVFSFKTLDGEQVLHISGEIYGALTSKKEYENYHLKLQFKWGNKVWEPRLLRHRDSGILYHCYGAYTAFWNVWMSSQEFQVEEHNIGDYYALAGTHIEIPSKFNEKLKEYEFSNKDSTVVFSSSQKWPQNHCNKGFDNENPHGEWNTLELICFEGSSLHIVNGKVVMALYNSQYQNSEKQLMPLTKGRIQIQSEAAEAYYKNIQIKSIKKIPAEFLKQAN